MQVSQSLGITVDVQGGVFTMERRSTAASLALVCGCPLCGGVSHAAGRPSCQL